MASWQPLDTKEEDDLHKLRLLNIEEKTFKRITKRLTTLNSLAASRIRQAPTPPPENDSADADNGGEYSDDKDLTQLKEDITVDFAAFDSTIARLQFSLAANDRERERYATHKEDILATCAAVRDSTVALRTQLEEARATLAQRKKFDELADQITARGSGLRPRDEQKVAIQKLEEECRQHEAESEAYATTWRERRDQFSRIMDEANRLRRLIRDEKEEVERREGMDDEEEGEAGDQEAGHTPRPTSASGNATPRHESGSLPKSVQENSGAAGTPLTTVTEGGSGTPAPGAPGPPGDDGGLKPLPRAMRSLSRERSREGTPRGGEYDDGQEKQREVGEDVEMDDPTRPAAADTPLEGTEGEEKPQVTGEGQDGNGDRMDMT